MFWRLLFVIAFTLLAVFNLALIMTAVEKKISWPQLASILAGQFLIFYVSVGIFLWP